MKRLIVTTLIAALGLVAACGSTFVVSKDGKGYYLGSGSTSAYTLLCETGDLKKVLTDTRLAQGMKDDLYGANCSGERSKEKVKRIYASLSPEQRKDLRLAFKKNGYEVNAMLC